MQHEAALHFEHDVGELFGIDTNLVGRSSCKRGGGSGIQAG